MIRESSERNGDIELDSIEIPGSGGARKSKLVKSGDTVLFPIEDAKTLWQALERGCRLYGNRRCMGWRSLKSDSYTWITYNEFIEKAQNFGSGLVNIGMSPGQSSIVGISGNNCLQWTVSQFGTLSQSAVVASLSRIHDAETIIPLIKRCEMEILICEDEKKIKDVLMHKEAIPTLKHIIFMRDMSNEMEELRKETHIHMHSFNDIEELGKKNPVAINPPHPTDVCVICFTSGTTGEPKGAEIMHQNLISSVAGIIMMGSNFLTEEDTTISYLPMAHLFEITVEVLMFLVGGSFGFYSGDINLLVDDMKVLQPTFLPAPPRVLNQLYDKAQSTFRPKPKSDIILKGNSPGSISESNTVKNVTDFSIYKPFLNEMGGKVRIIMSGTAPISDNVTDFYRHGLGCQMVYCYGLTECCVSNCNFMTHNTVGTVGPPSPCCIVKLVDVPEMGYYVEKGFGEVCIKGHNVFKGYLKDKKKTAEILDEEGWLHSGDVGTFTPNGHLKIMDRKNHIFKLSLGEYIIPERVESVYSRSPYVAQVLVCGDSSKNYLVAIVVPEKEAVLEWCRENLKCETWSEMYNSPVLKELILEDMRRMGKAAALRSFEQVKNIYLHPELMTIEDGFLTATMKLKRDFAKKFFKQQYEAMYCISENNK